MGLTSYKPELRDKEIQLRVLPPVERKKWIAETPANEVVAYGNANVPFGLIEFFHGRIEEISRVGLSDFEISRLLFIENKRAEAVALLQKALREGDERAYSGLGNQAYIEGKTGSAINLFLRGKDSSAKNGLGNIFKQMEPSTAYQYYKQAEELAAAEMNPAQGAIEINIGMLLADNGHPDKATPYFHQALNFGYFEAFMELARIAGEKGDGKEVSKVLLQASQVGYGPAIIQSALFLLQDGEKQKAQEMLELAEKLGYSLNDDAMRVSSAPRNTIGTA